MMLSTRVLRPRTSLRRMNSDRVSEHIWPVAARNLIPANHSSVVSRVSRAKSWRWVIREERMKRSLGLGVFELIIIAFGVMFSSVKSFICGGWSFEGGIAK